MGADALTLWKREESTGLITRATNSDDDRVMISVIGKNFMNSPMIPGQKIIGKKAHSVVMVELIIGQPTSLAAIRADSIRPFPSCMWR